MASYKSIPSVCLPRIWIHFDKEYVENVFCELLGQDAQGNSCVIKIDLVERTDRNTGDAYWLCFVHFSDKMVETETVKTFCARIENGGFNLEYDPQRYGRAYWKVRKNTNNKSSPARSGPRMMSERDEAELLKAQKEIKQQQAKCMTSPEKDQNASVEVEKPVKAVPATVEEETKPIVVGRWADEEE